MSMRRHEPRSRRGSGRSVDAGRKRLRQVGTQAVLMALECILRKKGNHIEMQCPHRLRLKREHGGTHIGVLPSAPSAVSSTLWRTHLTEERAISRPVWSSRQTTTLPPLAARCHAGEEREIVLLPLFFKLMPSKPSFCMSLRDAPPIRHNEGYWDEWGRQRQWLRQPQHRPLSPPQAYVASQP